MTKNGQSQLLMSLLSLLAGALLAGVGWVVVMGADVVDREELDNYVHQNSGIVENIKTNRGRIERLEKIADDVRNGMVEQRVLLLRIEGKIDKED